MGQLRDRSQFYYTMATMLEAGVTMVNALRQPFQGPFQNVSNRLYHFVDKGCSMSKAMSSEKIFSQFERTIIEVGERSGQIPEIFRMLAEWYEQRHSMRQRLIMGLLYPMFIYHLAGPVLGVIHIATGKSTAVNTLIMLAIWLSAPWFFLMLYKLFFKPLRQSAFVGRVAEFIPVLGNLQFHLETAIFYKALGMGLKSGMNTSDAITLAAAGCINKAYRKRFTKAGEAVRSKNCRFTEAICPLLTIRESHSAIFEILQTGEETGTLPDSCDRIAALHTQGATSIMNLLASMMPLMAYGLIMIYLIFKIITFYGDYLQPVNELLK